MKHNIFFILFLSILSANIISVPEEYLFIQLAIDNATDNDTILVNTGVYTENISVNNLSLSIISVMGSANTTIDGNYNGSTINIDAPGDSVLIKGFTIKNGIGEILNSGSRYGGGRLC